MDRFSDNSGCEGLLTIVQRLRPATVILVHGEHQSIDWIGDVILHQFHSTKVHAAEVGKQIMLFD